MPKTGLVIPTYNERENIAGLVDKILAIDDIIRILIVDDNSPDGTGVVADELAARNQRVQVVHRRGKGGRGSACIEGFKLLLSDGDVEAIMEMDADFSHAPEDIPKLLEASAEGTVVIGSRYLPASRIVGWSLKRRAFSKLANIYARGLLGVPISDYTNGFRCYRKECLQAMDFRRIRSAGYITLTELAYEIHRLGFTFREAPTLFVNRRRGTSNVSFKEISSAFTSVLRLKRESFGNRRA